MSYRFEYQEPFDSGFRRIAREQIDIARTLLGHAGKSPEAVHSVRKSLKRLRALVRLCRPCLAEADYQKYNTQFRDIARLLAASRDAHVMTETLAKLRIEPANSKTEATALRVLRQHVQKNLSEKPERTGKKVATKALQQLNGVRKELVELGFVCHGFEPVGEGLEVAFGRGRKAFREALENPADDTEHEWRKDVQQHWRHMQLLRNLWPDLCAARIALARELSQLLGDDHDIAVLHQFALLQEQDVLSAAHKAAISKIAQNRQDELRTAAFARGELLFADRPRDLRRRFTIYWAASESASGMGAVGSLRQKKKERPRRTKS